MRIAIRNPWLLVLTLLCAVGCHTPTPNDLVLLEIPGQSRFALSTEDGILALAGDELVGEIPAVQFWKGREIRDDLERIQQTQDLVLFKPKTARMTNSTFAAEDIHPDEMVYIQVINDDFERLPFVREARWYHDGEFGDLLALEGWFADPEGLATTFAGAGVYVKRKGVYEIAGILCGTVATNPNPSFFGRLFGPSLLLPFMRLDQIAPVLPQNSEFFNRGPRTFRPDFEHGLDREGRETERANRPNR